MRGEICALVFAALVAMASAQIQCSLAYNERCTDCNATQCTECQVGFIVGGTNNQACIACNLGNCLSCVVDDRCAVC